jgi:hypothetical protein
MAVERFSVPESEPESPASRDDAKALRAQAEHQLRGAARNLRRTADDAR